MIRTTPTSAYDAGNLTYTDGNGNTMCFRRHAVAALDAGCEICKTSAYPNPPGDNPNALGFFKSMPAANGNSEGDGLNEGSFAFSSPNPSASTPASARLDWIPSDKNRIFVRGNLQDDSTANAENFPGQPPASTLIDDSKGVTAGETWTINSHMVNDIRYGYIRQGYASSGIGVGDYVDFRFLSSPTAESRTSVTAVPVNNVVDDLSWTKGNHTFQFGYNWRLIHQNHSSDSGSFNSATTNPYWLGGNPPDSRRRRRRQRLLQLL